MVTQRAMNSVYFHATHTFTDGSIGRELVPDRTGTQSSPGFINTHMAAAAVVHRANTSCRRWNVIRHRRTSTRSISLHHVVWRSLHIRSGKVSGSLLQHCDPSHTYRRLWARRCCLSNVPVRHTSLQQIDTSPQDNVCRPHHTDLWEERQSGLFNWFSYLPRVRGHSIVLDIFECIMFTLWSCCADHKSNYGELLHWKACQP